MGGLLKPPLENEARRLWNIPVHCILMIGSPWEHPRRARQFSADIIDKIGERHLELKAQIPRDDGMRKEIITRVEQILAEPTAAHERIKEVS